MTDSSEDVNLIQTFCNSDENEGKVPYYSRLKQTLELS